MIQSDLKSLSRYLSWALNTDVRALGLTSMAGGVHHNWCVTVETAGNVKKFVVRRMPPSEQFGYARREVTPYRLQKEFNVLQELAAIPLAVPKAWGFDEEGEFLGTPAFVMEFIEGITVLEAVQQKPDVVLPSYAEAIVAMNAILPAQVPSSDPPTNCDPEPLRWLVDHSRGLQLPVGFARGLEMLHDIPPYRPAPAFGNGDLNPQNFIYTPNGITIIDWEYAGFNDPLMELMLLHVWPEDEPFLAAYPLDHLYCNLTKIDSELLRWYELYGALSGWIYAAKDNRLTNMVRHEHWLNKLLS